jgi:hypothetical protein
MGLLMPNLLIGGANRGARTILSALTDETVRRYDPWWIVADPKAHRAADLAILAQQRFARLTPQPLQMRVQSALPYSREHDTLVLLLDTIADTAETLMARRSTQRVTFQIAGRGPGGSFGTRLALQGTLCPDDQATEQSAHLLLTSLSGMSQAVSSRVLRGPDPITAAVLHPLRTVASRQTVRHLEEREREPGDLSGGPLSVVFGQTTYPLVPVPGGRGENYPHWKARALESAGVVAKHAVACGSGSRVAVVAVVIPDPQAIHFLRVSENCLGKRSVTGVTTFAPLRVTQRSSINSAVFTD